MSENNDKPIIIEAHGGKYELSIEPTGETSLSRFNEKYGMYVKLIFSNNPVESPSEFIKEILTKQYIDRIMGNSEDI